jgi:5-methylthioadenosine/S-adenosylhomocysteine deaminase
MGAFDRKVRLGLLISVALCCAPSGAQQNQYALRGTLVTPTEIIENGTILVTGEKIEAVGKDIKVPAAVKTINTGGFIYPGLIDLHDHLTWNFLPRWKPNREFANRYEWQAVPEYKVVLTTPEGKVFDEGLACDTEQYAEVKAIVGGATSVVGSLNQWNQKPDKQKCIEGLARNLDFYSGLYPANVARPGNVEKLRNEVFPLELPESEVASINKGLADGTLTAFLVHLAEGKPTDAASTREFRMLKARGFLRPGVSIIHGVALHQPEFQQMHDAQVGLIWSPRSNIALYGDTTDVRTAKQNQLTMAISPDWSPTGSDGMLQELKYAATWNAGQSPPVFTDAELVQMATINPAKLAKLDAMIGSLTPNHFADLLVIKSRETDAYRALLHANPGDVALVVIGGMPVYGDSELMEKLAPLAELETLQVCGVPKALDFQSEKLLQGSNPKSWKQTTQDLNRALNEWGETLAHLTECPN